MIGKMGLKNSTILRSLISVAAVVILLAGVKALSFIMAPVLFALAFAIILSPLYQWLQKKGVPAGLALLLMVLGALIIGLGLIGFLAVSFNQLQDQIASYQDQMAVQQAGLDAWATSRGVDLSDLNLLDAIGPEKLAQAAASLVKSMSRILGVGLFALVTLLFMLLESANFPSRLRQALGPENPLLPRFTSFGHTLVRYLVIRTIVNLITGSVFAVFLLVLGIDFALLWGVLVFFLSYVPYIGITLAAIPPVLLALLELGPIGAIVVVIGTLIINASAENLVAPKMLGKGLSISPVVVFIAFIFWSWLLGPLGIILAMPLTVMLMLILDGFPETRWLSILMSTTDSMSVAADQET